MLVQSDLSSFAARRYRRYKWEQQKQAIKKKAIALLLKVLEAIAKALQKARIVQRRIETVNVE